jgi:hypothetical protein
VVRPGPLSGGPANDHGTPATIGRTAADATARPTAALTATASAAAASGGRAHRVTRQRARSGPAYDDHDDDALAAYNHYLGWLNAHPDAPASDYPGLPGNEEEK